MRFTGEGHAEGSMTVVIAGPGEKDAGPFQSCSFH